jgi:hypothetical protein
MRPDLGDLEVFDISFLANQTVKKNLFFRMKDFAPSIDISPRFSI